MPVETSSSLGAGGMERTPLTSPDTLRVRCPHCRKLYLVQFSDIQEAKPRFECVQCRNRFWLALPDGEIAGEILGIPMQSKEPPKAPTPAVQKTEPCPKCFKPVPVGKSECTHCGVVMEKVRNALNFSEPLPAHSPTLAALWKRLVADYGDDELHAEFLRACQRERGLAYAGAQYAAMQRLMPSDEITSQRLKEIQALGATMLPRSKRLERMPRGYPHLWQMPLMGATIVIIVGMVIPMFRNLVGVGAALLFLAMALRFQFGRKGP